MNYKYVKIISIVLILLLLSMPTLGIALKPYLRNTSNSFSEYYEYVIITDESLSHVFKRLIDYKSQFITSKLVTLETILQNQTYPGIDTQEKIRSFITFAFNNWNTKYVLLGGDVSIIPERRLHAEMIDWKGDTKISEIPSDMYYGCLGGTWDNDKDYIFGETKQDSTSDEADLIAEVYIGRAPVENSFEASVFVNKVISFETSEKPNKITLHQSGLNPENNPSSNTLIDSFAKWIPRNEYTIESLYSVLYNITADDWISSINDGRLILQHAGNGAEQQYDLDNINDNEVWTFQDIKRLRNTFYPIHLSLSCFSGDYSLDDCVAEKMLLFPYGGTSACIFNSDLGATDRNQAIKYSGEFLERQIFEIFQTDTSHLGKIMQKAKEYFVEKAYEHPKYRWCYYALNLLGDPESPIFTQRACENSLILLVDDDFNSQTIGWNVTRFNSIKKAIDRVDNGGTILVYNGEYHGDITISKSVYLFGSNTNFESDIPGLTSIIGSGTDHVVTVSSDNIFIDGLVITNSGSEYAGVYIDNVNNTNIYRSDIVTNQGNGVHIKNSDSCIIFDTSLSFNKKNGITLEGSNGNILEELEIAYNKENGILLKNSDYNEIIGLSSPRQSPIDFYGSQIFHKNQDLNLTNLKDLSTFISIFISEYSEDIIERLFYYPIRPPTESENLLTFDYSYIINNKNGIILENSINNTLKYLWIETEGEGIGIQIRNCTEFSNYIISNFIYNNIYGIDVENSLISSLFLNNFYNNDKALIFHNASGISLSKHKKVSFFVGGNIILNEQTPLPRFRWMFLDRDNDILFIDAIALSLFSGYIGTSILLTTSIILSKIYPLPIINLILSGLLLLTSISPYLLKYVKINQPPPIFDIGSN